MHNDELSWFPGDYFAARERFREGLAAVQALWPGAELHSYALPEAPELSIDWITAQAADPRRLLALTTGEHGIEGFVGAAVMQLFLAEYLARLDPSTTGLLLVQPINPWGMAQRRRVNAHNVDLNRNFNYPDAAPYDPQINPEYSRLEAFLNPQGRLGGRWRSELRFWGGLLGGLLRLGVGGLTHATLQGQYRLARGVYYGGETPQAETRQLKKLYQAHFGAYPQVVHIDVHSGYGPREQMTLVNSIHEPRSSQEFARQVGYPWVVRANPEEFYPIQGDMVDYVYQLVQNELPGVQRLFATAFEYGTLGDSTLDGLRSLRVMILENQLHKFGCRQPGLQAWIEKEFMELYCPSDPAWRRNALNQARRAFDCILGSERYLTSEGSLAYG